LTIKCVTGLKNVVFEIFSGLTLLCDSCYGGAWFSVNTVSEYVRRNWPLKMLKCVHAARSYCLCGFQLLWNVLKEMSLIMCSLHF